MDIPSLSSEWLVDKTIAIDETHLVLIRFGFESTKECLQQDLILSKIQQ